ncbi:MAG: hypothetical protein U0931_29245 [Vulcanimicrobiota bacterium]
MQFTGSIQEVGDQLERLRGLNRSLELQARNRLLLGLLGIGGFALTLVIHVAMHPGTKIPLTSSERIGLTVSALLAVAGTVAFRLTSPYESRRLRLAAGLLQFWSTGEATLTLDLNRPESDHYDQTWLKIQVGAVRLSLRRVGTSWLDKGQRRYRYQETCEIVGSPSGPTVNSIPPNPRLAGLSVQQNDDEVRIEARSPTTTLDGPENLEAADLLGLLQQLWQGLT